MNMLKQTYLFILLICLSHIISAKKVADFPDLFNPIGIVVNSQYIYISQDFNIFIYSAKDYGMIKKFGKKGEGPGEFLYIPYIYVRPNHIIASTNNKVLYYSLDGEFLKEKNTRPAGTWVVPFKDIFAARKYMRGKDDLRYHGVMLLDAQMNRIKDIYQHVHGYQGLKAEFNPLTISPPEFSACGDLLLMRNGERTKVIVFSQQGEKLFELTDPEEAVKFAEEDKKEFIRLSKSYNRLKSIIKFPDYHPPIRWFYADPAGKRIYLETEYTEDKKRRWRVYNFKGQFIKKIMLPVLNEEYTSWNFELLNAFYDGKCYQLKEKEENWGLHIIEIE
jgi:hypothetical protein